MKHLILALTCLLVLIAAPARAQESVVRQAKADLSAAGVKVENGPCTDFEIVKVVAGRVPGAGLLTKACCGEANDPNRSHCEYRGVWYAHDVVAFADGSIADIAIAGGEANGPAWQLSPADPGLASRYRSAASLGLTGVVGGGGVGPVPTPVPVPGPVVDVAALRAELLELRVNISRVVLANEDLQRQLADLNGRIDGAESHATNAINLADRLRDYLTAHPLADGCKVPFLGCRLTFNNPAVQ